jgi:hypothetical protein
MPQCCQKNPDVAEKRLNAAKNLAAFQDRSPFLPKNSKRWEKNPGDAKKTPTLPKKGQHFGFTIKMKLPYFFNGIFF